MNGVRRLFDRVRHFCAYGNCLPPVKKKFSETIDALRTSDLFIVTVVGQNLNGALGAFLVLAVVPVSSP